MKKKIFIEGMSCAHCAGRVRAALEALPGVTAAEINLKKKTAVIKLDAPVGDGDIKKAVADAGYAPGEIK